MCRRCTTVRTDYERRISGVSCSAIFNAGVEAPAATDRPRAIRRATDEIDLAAIGTVRWCGPGGNEANQDC